MYKFCSQNLLASFLPSTSQKQQQGSKKASLVRNDNIIRSLYVKPQSKSSTGKSLFKGFIYVEIALFVGSYILWKRMNDSQEFRYYMKSNFPTILEGKPKYRKTSIYRPGGIHFFLTLNFWTCHITTIKAYSYRKVSTLSEYAFLIVLW